MFGSNLVQFVTGGWVHIGYLNTVGVVLPNGTDAVPGNDKTLYDNPTLPKGTWLAPTPAVNPAVGSDQAAVLASGFAYGFTTQDIDAFGQTSLAAFHNRIIGKRDLPIQISQNVSLRQPTSGSIVEFEGKGAAVPGNLVCTSGTGAITAGSTAIRSKLSFLNGCIRVAQTGDLSNCTLLETALTPRNVGYTRIRVMFDAGGVV